MSALLVKTFKFFILLLLAGACGSYARAAGYTPAWRQGQQWTVKAVYIKPPPQQGWSHPLFWRYTVMGVENLDGRPCYRVQVVPADNPSKAETTLWVDQDNFLLTSVEVVRNRRGRRIPNLLRFDQAAPVKTRHTITPYDWPVFPILPGSETHYRLERQVGVDLKTVERVKQQVENTTAGPELPGVPAGTSLMKVTCTGRDDRLLFEHYYEPDAPWPVYGVNDSMQYWLVTP